MFFTLIGVLVLGSVITLANMQVHRSQLALATRTGLILLALSGTLMGFMVLLNALAPPETPAIASIEPSVGMAYFGLTLALTLISLAVILSLPFREWLARNVLHVDGKMRHYSPHSPVHTAAIVIAFLGMVITLGNFILLGGVGGLATELETVGYNALDLITNLLLYSSLALVGVGLFIRRDLVATAKRLGLWIQADARYSSFVKLAWHVFVGLFVGMGLFVMQIGLGLVWQLTVSPEMLAEQTAASEALFNALSGSLWLGLLLALTAGIGEELLFRGALQPIFGNVLVSLFFVLLHAQYTLTPAALIIFFVSVGLGFLRTQYSTISAIFAHIIYNFMPFLLIALLGELGISF